MKEMLMASLLFHRRNLRLLRSNHCILQRMDFLRNQTVVHWLEANRRSVRVCLPWEQTDEDFQGIPGTFKTFHDMAALKQGKPNLVKEFVDGVSAVLTESGIGGSANDSRWLSQHGATGDRSPLGPDCRNGNPKPHSGGGTRGS
mmetsp:Transcript_19356/g.53219  ORF Transcript_19356/g.53219 Transcript_19356/m.53219 type:complete len:144 (-) Transcript_19356:1166-1597(-)